MANNNGSGYGQQRGYGQSGGGYSLGGGQPYRGADWAAPFYGGDNYRGIGGGAPGYSLGGQGSGGMPGFRNQPMSPGPSRMTPMQVGNPETAPGDAPAGYAPPASSGPNLDARFGETGGGQQSMMMSLLQQLSGQGGQRFAGGSLGFPSMGGGMGGGMMTNGPESLGLWNGQPFDPNNNPWEAMRGNGQRYAGGSQGFSFNGLPSLPPGWTPPPLKTQPPYMGSPVPPPATTPPIGSAPPVGQQPSGAVDHMANLRGLMGDPAAAYQYTNLDPAVSKWFFGNQGGIRDQMFGGNQDRMNDWLNMQGGMNRTSGGSEQTNRLRQMAGLPPIDAWRFGAQG